MTKYIRIIYKLSHTKIYTKEYPKKSLNKLIIFCLRTSNREGA
jgi:hypothetical protein